MTSSKNEDGIMYHKRNDKSLQRIKRCLVKTLIISMLLFSFLYIPNNVVQNAEAGKYGNIVPSTFELQLLDKINENRSDNGAGALRLNTSMWWVARAHCQDMIDYDFFDHTSSQEGQFSGATFSERVRNYAEYASSYVGECIAWNSWGPDPEWCMDAWKNSPGHWSIIIDPQFTEIGLGIVQGEWDGWQNSALYTADFGRYTISVDLTLSESDINFDPQSPIQGDPVLITATIHNQGSTDSYPVQARIYDGDPDFGGVQIGADKNIPHILTHGESVWVNVTWDTTGETGSHDIYVVVDYNDIVSESDEGNNKAYRTITINDTSPSYPPQNFSVSLHYGWNLVSFPLVVSDTSLGQVLDSISGEYDSVQYYNSSDTYDSWKHFNIHKPSNMRDLQNLDNKKGFLIHVSNSQGVELTVEGDAPSYPFSIHLNSGWNLVSYPSETAHLRDDALKNLVFGVEIDAIMVQNNVTMSLEDMEAVDYMKPGKGYWIHATEDCDWVFLSS
jgi:uncharacterized protein YkwD